MTESFDKVLDQCIDQLLSGQVTVEECLARHPEHAAELESHLRAASSLLVAASFTPNPAAKARGRQRLQAEMAELNRRDAAARSNPFPLFSLFKSRPWATALAGLVLALFIGGPTVVAASGQALPGDQLYTVKRGFEETRVAFQFSQVGKADLYLAFSERRAEELSRLVANGDTEQIPPTQKKLNAHLKAVARIAQSLDDERELDAMRSKLDARASRSLSSMQTALGEAPAVSKTLATDSFQASSEAFGDAVEKIASQFPRRSASKAQGSLLVIAAEPPGSIPPGIDGLLLQVNRIQVHRAGDPESTWTTLASEPVNVDLLRIATIGNVLGQRSLEPGTYSKVRLSIANARVIAGGVEQQAAITNDTLTFTRPFRVEEEQTAVVYLDFDAARSLQKTASGAYILSPVIRVLTAGPANSAAPGQNRPEDKPSPGERGKGQGRGNGNDKGLTVPESMPGYSDKVEILGPITRLEGGAVAIGSQQVAITSDTVIEDAPEVGDHVAIQAVVGADGALAATRITVGQEKGNVNGQAGGIGPVASTPRSGSASRKEEPRSGQGEKGKGGAAAKDPPAAATPTALSNLRFQGTIEALGPTAWWAGGLTIQVSPATILEGRPELGARVQVDGVQGPGGVVNAARIIILPGEPSRRDGQIVPPVSHGGATAQVDTPASQPAKTSEAQPTAITEGCLGGQITLPNLLVTPIPVTACP